MTSIESAMAPIELQRSDDCDRWVAVATVDRLADFQTRAGELARTGGSLGLHHQTMVVVAFG